MDYSVFLDELGRTTKEIYQKVVGLKENEILPESVETDQLCRLICDLLQSSFELGVHVSQIIRFVPGMNVKEYRNPDMIVVVKKLLKNKCLVKVLDFIKENWKKLEKKGILLAKTLFASQEHTMILVNHLRGIEALGINFEFKSAKKKKKRKRKKKKRRKGIVSVIKPAKVGPKSHPKLPNAPLPKLPQPPTSPSKALPPAPKKKLPQKKTVHVIKPLSGIVVDSPTKVSDEKKIDFVKETPPEEPTKPEEKASVQPLSGIQDSPQEPKKNEDKFKVIAEEEEKAAKETKDVEMETPVSLSLEESQITPFDLNLSPRSQTSDLLAMISPSHSSMSALPKHLTLLKEHKKKPSRVMSLPQDLNNLGIGLNLDELETSSSSESDYSSSSEQESEEEGEMDDEEVEEEVFKKVAVYDKSESGERVVYHIPAGKSKVKQSFMVLDQAPTLTSAKFCTIHSAGLKYLGIMSTTHLHLFSVQKEMIEHRHSISVEKSRNVIRPPNFEQKRCFGWSRIPTVCGVWSVESESGTLQYMNLEMSEMLGRVDDVGDVESTMDVIYLRDFCVFVKLRSIEILSTAEMTIKVTPDKSTMKWKRMLTCENPHGVCVGHMDEEGGSAERMVCLGKHSGSLRLVELSSDKNGIRMRARDREKVHSSRIKCVAFATGGNLFVTCSETGGMLRIFDWDSGNCVKEIRRSYFFNSSIHSLAMSKNNDFVCCYSDLGILEVFSVTTRWFYINTQIGEQRSKNVGGRASLGSTILSKIKRRKEYEFGIVEFCSYRNNVIYFLGYENGCLNRVEVDYKKKSVQDQRIQCCVFDEIENLREAQETRKVEQKKMFVLPFVEAIIRDIFHREFKNWLSLEHFKGLMDEALAKRELRVVEDAEVVKRAYQRVVDKEIRSFMRSVMAEESRVSKLLQPIFERRMSVNQVVIRRTLDKFVTEKAFRRFHRFEIAKKLSLEDYGVKM